MLSHIALAWCLTLIGFACFLNYIWDRFFSIQGLPSNLPWAGAGDGPISRANTVLHSLFGLREIIQDGYYKVRLVHREWFTVPC
jgi:hypothetical protein